MNDPLGETCHARLVDDVSGFVFPIRQLQMIVDTKTGSEGLYEGVAFS